MNRKNRRTSLRRAVQNELYRLGMQAKSEEVVAALAQCDIEVSEELVERVKVEMLKDQSGVSCAVHHLRERNQLRNRRRLQRIPEKRPRGK